jgi:hypothetical protein
MSQAEHKLLSSFLDSNVEKIYLKIVGVQVISPQAAQKKMCGRSINCQQRLTKYHFGNPCQVKLLAWIRPANSNIGQEHAKFVPQLLTNEQNQQRMFVCHKLLDEVRNDKNFLSRIITGNETWVHCYILETKQQSCQWESPYPPHPKMRVKSCRT